MQEQTFSFFGTQLVEIDQAADQILVADSFAVHDGRARSLDRHITRFNRAASELTDLDLSSFWAAVIDHIPGDGSFFPRIELTKDGLIVRIRSVPDFKPTVTLWTSDEPDKRVSPLTKGPDLAYGTMLRRKANLHGADEAIILNEEGLISDGALSAIVWWEGDTIYGLDESTKWLPSVTRMDIFDLANQAGFKTGTRSISPSELHCLEVWSLSSLSGIRPVTYWIGENFTPGKTVHLESFQRRLRLMARDIHDSFG